MDPSSGIVIYIYTVQHVAAWSSELGLGFCLVQAQQKAPPRLLGRYIGTKRCLANSICTDRKHAKFLHCKNTQYVENMQNAAQ